MVNNLMCTPRALFSRQWLSWVAEGPCAEACDGPPVGLCGYAILATRTRPDP